MAVLIMFSRIGLKISPKEFKNIKISRLMDCLSYTYLHRNSCGFGIKIKLLAEKEMMLVVLKKIMVYFKL